MSEIILPLSFVDPSIFVQHNTHAIPLAVEKLSVVVSFFVFFQF
jgi:hypothetical protein